MNKNTPAPQIAMTPRIRKSPYYEATAAHGIKALSVYNHMYMPSRYHEGMTDYENLTRGVTLWDVAVERQVQIKGPDAARFTQYLTCRDISACQVGQCLYVPIVDDRGGILNDPILLRVEDDTYWLSLADYDILLWARGLNVHMGMDVDISEPDVSPLAVQGPRAEDLLADLFGEWIRDIKFFWFRAAELNGIPMQIARSGWSKQGGFELYLQDGSRGIELWNTIFEAGAKHQIAPGAPHYIERIESSLLDYGRDLQSDMNPYEAGFDAYVNLDMQADFLARAALTKIKSEGIERRLVGLTITGEPLEVNQTICAVESLPLDKARLTSYAWSPRFNRNIGIALVPLELGAVGSRLTVITDAGPRTAEVCEFPFR